MLTNIEIYYLISPIFIKQIYENMHEWDILKDRPPIIDRLGPIGSLYCVYVYLTTIVSVLSLLLIFFFTDTPLVVVAILIAIGYAASAIMSGLRKRLTFLILILRNALAPGYFAAGLIYLGIIAWA